MRGVRRAAPPRWRGPPGAPSVLYMIELEGLTKHYGDKIAVDHLTFTVRPGIVTGFLGPNGAGKSTTMRMMLDLDHPTAGTVRIDGKHYRQLKDPLTYIGALLDAKAMHGGRSAHNHLLCLAQSNGIPRSRVARGAGHRRAERGRQEALEGLLPRHGPAARYRRGAARRPARS